LLVIIVFSAITGVSHDCSIAEMLEGVKTSKVYGRVTVQQALVMTALTREKL
jgi:hypothetical protein